MKFDQKLWNQMRDAVEQGREAGATIPAASTAAVSASTAAAPSDNLINVDLPYESGLSIAGRKLISVKLEETRRKSAERARELGVPQQQHNFDMHQEMQVKIKGKVGPKIAVNVDFDDTKDDKRDISVVYTGDKNEVVQEAAFGDITLSLPSTEFVSYSKQLFGVRTRLKYKNAQIMAIGSRTKGVTETKRFNGNVKSNREELLDTSYIRYRYYNINFAGRPIRPGTIKVWRDDLNPATDIPSRTEFNVTAEDFSNASSTYTGNFDLMAEGQDYALDLKRGLVIFTRPIDPSAVLIIDYNFDDDGSLLSATGGGRRKLLKTSNDQSPDPLNPSLLFSREVKTFYSIGQTKIVPDNGQGNFILTTEDLNRLTNAVFLTNGQQLVYPGNNIEVDPVNGIFNIVVPVQVDTTTQKLYDQTPEHKFSFVVQYQYKVNSYIIKPNIVLGSERVTMNGRLLARDVDYFMDYDSGFLTFFDTSQIDDTTQIEVTYEFAPFGTQLGETLVGSRTELDLVPGRFKAGSTFLYDFAPKPTLVPDVRSTPRSLSVLEADSQLKDWKIPFTPATLGLQAEVAKSKENPNLLGKAIIDNMEGVTQETEAIMGPEAWHPAANPDPFANGVGRPDALWTSLSDEQVKFGDINTNGSLSQTQKDEKVRILTMPFALGSKPGGSGPEMVSIVQSLSKGGLDFSKKVSLEMWVQGAGAAGTGVDMCVDIGEFNEDADGSGLLKTEDANLDGTLNFGEDGGWRFSDPGPDGIHSGDVIIGAGNARLDSEDFDGDGVLRRGDITPRGTGGLPLFCLSAAHNASSHAADTDVRLVDPVTGTSDNSIADLSFTGWRFITVPLKIDPSEEPNFEAIKQVRLSLVNGTGGGPTFNEGTLQMAKLSFVGNTWEKSTTMTGSTMTISAVNNVDNPDYRSLLGNPDFQDLYKDEATSRTREQALSLQYTLAGASTATTREVFQLPRDFSNHRTLKFFLQVPLGKSPGGFLSLQMGSETDYYEYKVPLTPNYVGNWVLETLQLVDLNGDGIPDVIVPQNPQAVVKVVGSPSFQQIGQLKLVVTNDAPIATLASEVWVNEIFLTGSRKKEGHAQRFSADLLWPQWGSVGGRIRSVDRNFQTLTAQVLNQDKNDSSANFSLTRLQKWLPLSGNVTKSETVTPAVFRTGDAGLVSLLSEGHEVSVTGRGDGQLLIPHLPAFAFSYDKNLSNSTSLGQRRDKDTYSGSADYAVPWAPDIIPGRLLTFRPLPQNVFVKYSHSNSFLDTFSAFAPAASTAPLSSTQVLTSQDLLFNQARVVEFTDQWTGRAPFAPWDGLSLQPTFSWTRVHEQRRFSEDLLSQAQASGLDFSPAKAYQKAMSQSAGISGSWRILRWFEPRFDGQVDGSENNVLPTASSPTAFNVKTINRTAKGDLFWTFRAMDLAPNFRPTQSLRLDNSYRLESGDAYQNVDKDFSGWRKVNLFNTSKVSRTGGRRMYDLLGPLDVAPSGGSLQQRTDRNSLRSSLDWSPFDWLPLRGPVEPLRTFRMTVTMTDTEEHTETGAAVSDVSTLIWPDLLFSVRDTERMLHLDRWMTNSQLNFRSNRKDAVTFQQSFSRTNALGSDYHFLWNEKYDVFLSYSITNGFTDNLQTGFEDSRSKGYNHSIQVGTKLFGWQVTPRGDFKSDVSIDSAGRLTQDTQIQTYSVLLRLDKAYPHGFRIPFTHKIYENVNRLIVDGKISYERKTSGIDVENNNTDTYSATISGEWEISKHFRLSFGAGLSEIENRVRRDDSLMTANMNSQLVINF